MGPPGAGEGVPNDFAASTKQRAASRRSAQGAHRERDRPDPRGRLPWYRPRARVRDRTARRALRAALAGARVPAHGPGRLSVRRCSSSRRLPNVRPPLVLDASDRNWPALRVAEAAGAGGVAAVLIINLTHISPWVATLGAVRVPPRRCAWREAHHYGPFKIDGRHTSEGNATFDESLRGQNPDWGYRDVEAVVAIGEDCGLRKLDVVEMPANNLTLVLCKRD